MGIEQSATIPMIVDLALECDGRYLERTEVNLSQCERQTGDTDIVIETW
jgi:hypothetical protein